MSNILVIDDNAINRETFADVLGSEGHTVISAASGEEGLAKMGAAVVDAVLCDLRLPNLDGLATMELAQEKYGKVPWILVTGHGNEETAVSAIKQGAFNYLPKPVDLSRLKATVESAIRLASATRENKALRKELGYDEALDRIVGTSQAVRLLKSQIRQVAGTDATVLIEGESGTGKELVADAVQALSQRAGRPYVKINTAAIPRDLLESELFGHERGAFTGAVQLKKGKFEIADGGTLFLDEIGEMPLESQVKLLRTLQDGSFHRVGGNESLNTNVRIICATNRNLKGEVLANRFRMDLYFRLNVVNLQVSPLRERREDIPLLARSFLDRLNRRHDQQKQLSEAAVQHLRRQDWQGNVRELENHLEKLFVLTAGRVIDPEISGFVRDEPQLPSERLRRVSSTSSVVTTHQAMDADEAIRLLIGLPADEVEKRLILATLAHCGGNKTKAAKLLQLGVKTLYRKLIEYGHQADEHGDLGVVG
jgi:DNA-binding NtrC family response regulator